MSAEQPPSAFTASGEDAIARSIDTTSGVSAQRSESSDVDEFYEIKRTAEIVREGNYKRVSPPLTSPSPSIVVEHDPQVALQFPDELLHDAVPIYRSLKRSVGDGHDLYVLADTSYGK